ncbi:MAG: NAD(P)H-hydrate dehydratase [Clostridia bacterium]|nr:NAD(P)H-hydrate dehydratase [Clostridia bacterium]
MKILTKELIRESEESAVLNGAFTFRQLMYKAGITAGDIINKKLSCNSKKIAILCGNGNNGGDGFVIADYLYGIGADVTVIIPFGKPKTSDAKYYFDNLEFVKMTDSFEGNFDIIIDALFGIGYMYRENNLAEDLFEKINNANGIKVAVDIPSGVEANSGFVGKNAVKADLTVTFIALKPCFVLPDGSDYCGEVVIADIGVIPKEGGYSVIEKPRFEKRRHNSHKGSYGTAVLITGSYGMAGAAILAAKSALRSGLGIAKCVLCESIYAPFTSSVPEAVCLPKKQKESGVLDSSDINIKELTQNASALLFGCGVGKGIDIRNILEDVIKNSKVPVVIDADGINALADGIDILKEAEVPLILTPHPGEMARLCGKNVKEIEADRINVARQFAKEYDCTLVLKGANTIVAHKNGDIYFNLTGNPGMATGGSGDVLSGIIVSLLAQGHSPEFSAKSGVYLHGAAADKAAEKRSMHALIPSDIIEEL